MTIMTTATLVKVVRDPRSGEVHLPNEEVAIMSVIRNLNRTLLKVRWQAGGSCVVFPEDLDANHPRTEATYAVEPTSGVSMDDPIAVDLGQSATEGERVQLV
jgi:hypothetical protein